MPESVTDRCTKAHEYIFLLAKGQRKTRVVTLSDLHSERVHLGQNLGFESPDSGAIAISIGLASSILNCPKFQKHFGLTSFNPQIWKQKLDSITSGFVGCLPIENRAALIATRFLLSDCSAKEFLCEIYGFGISLSNGNNFLIGGILTEFSLSPPINSYGKTAIAIHNSGKICQFDFLHGTIIHEVPSGCKYYYDNEAIKEWSIDKESLTGRRPRNAGKMDSVDADNYKFHGSVDENGKLRHGQIYEMRNRRSVWTITTKPFKEAHFATFPPEIPEICIKAGSRVGDTILDPFMGSGTTGLVAEKLQRNFVGIELNPEYLKMAKDRIYNVAPR